MIYVLSGIFFRSRTRELALRFEASRQGVGRIKAGGGGKPIGNDLSCMQLHVAGL